MRGDVHGDVEVAGRTAVRAGRAAPCEPDLLTLADAGGDRQIEVLDLALTAFDRLDERDRHLGDEIAAAHRPLLRATAAAKAAEDVAEDVAEIEVDRLPSRLAVALRVRSPGAILLGALRIEADLLRLAPHLVVELSLLRIGEHFVGGVDLLEAGLRAFVARVDVRVVLSRFFAEGSLELLLRRGSRDLQGLIVILRHRTARRKAMASKLPATTGAQREILRRPWHMGCVPSPKERSHSWHSTKSSELISAPRTPWSPPSKAETR